MWADGFLHSPKVIYATGKKVRTCANKQSSEAIDLRLLRAQQWEEHETVVPYCMMMGAPMKWGEMIGMVP